jgi:hypothetical protein
MFIIRHLFGAITCNKLIISVTLVLNYMSKRRGLRSTELHERDRDKRQEALLQTVEKPLPSFYDTEM